MRHRLTHAGWLHGVAGAILLVAGSAAPLHASAAPDTAAGQHSPPAHSPVQHVAAAAMARPAVLSSRVIGHSANGHRIRAYELGDRSAARTVVAIGAMHGDETGGLVVLDDLRDGTPVHGVHLWVIPRDNPDGVLTDNRHNGRGVDLNRNFEVRWQFQRGYYYSGPHPSSEPETRGLERFLDNVDPVKVVTFHSPLYGVGRGPAKTRPFAHRLSRALRLPLKRFDCSGGCHGTLSQWFDARHDGACVTVEFGDHPSDRYLHFRAPRGLLWAVGGHRELTG